MNPSLKVKKKNARKIEVNGVVQGVGFRPFLFALAGKYNLTGEVANTDTGVCLVVEGEPVDIEQFMADMIGKKPPLSDITQIKDSTADLVGFESFTIVKSRAAGHRSALVSPDVTVCKDCLSELYDPEDRRFEYPFINCTNCGPRYTIIQDIPYDRPKTSMKNFKFCKACQKEYDNPMDRRFHAQPNACPKCGPRVFLTDSIGRTIESEPGKALETAARLLGQGKIIGIKGVGGFHLACDATDSQAVLRLRKQKNRPHKPFALMAENTSAILDHVHVSPDEKKLLESCHSPIVLLKKKAGPDRVSTRQPHIAPGVARRSNDLGIMLPSTPLHHLLLTKGPDILVMTSGNRSGEPLSTENDDAIDAFSHIADYFLLHNRDIYFGADDSVVKVTDKKTGFIRRSRGYAPLPIHLDREMPAILGCGAGMKNTICLTRGRHAFLSPHIGDLDNAKVFQYFQKNIAHLQQILDIRPECVAHDLHPGYMSSEYARTLTHIKRIPVQHHHAHAAACMAEHHLDEPVLAVTLDGTGYGTDSHIWGGEILLTTRKTFTRKAHLSYIQLPGGDAAVREPWRMAVSLLYRTFGQGVFDLDLPFLRETDKKKVSFICQMMDKDLNSPLTSSAGRMFDAVSALLCIRQEITYESQAAMELEAIAGNLPGHGYDFHISTPARMLTNDQENRPHGLATDDNTQSMVEIDLIPAVRQMVQDIRQGISPGRISANFHATLVNAFSQAALIISRETGIDKIVLSGGVFNNVTILKNMVHALEETGMTVYTHTLTPAGDGCISLGQAVVAAALEGN